MRTLREQEKQRLSHLYENWMSYEWGSSGYCKKEADRRYNLYAEFRDHLGLDMRDGEKLSIRTWSEEREKHEALRFNKRSGNTQKARASQVLPGRLPSQSA